VNISKSGLLLKLNQIFIVGDKITILINLENHFESLLLEAEVRHVNGQYVGLRFINIDVYGRVMLKEYISEKLDGKFKLSNEGYDK
jgi:Tfp pilus assembly protein PilZ